MSSDWDWYWKRGDTLPLLRRTLKYSDGTVIDLTAATSVALMIGPLDGSSSAQAVGTVAVIDAAGGIVEFSPASADTATAGGYRAEFECIIGGKRLTVPSGPQGQEYLRILITEDLGDQ